MPSASDYAQFTAAAYLFIYFENVDCIQNLRLYNMREVNWTENKGGKGQQAERGRVWASKPTQDPPKQK